MSVQAQDMGEGASPRSKYDRLIAAAKAIPPAGTLVVHPCDESSLRGVVEAAEVGPDQADSGRAGRKDQGCRSQSTASTSAASRSSMRRTARPPLPRPSS